jgi:hypothetical protein
VLSDRPVSLASSASGIVFSNGTIFVVHSWVVESTYVATTSSQAWIKPSSTSSSRFASLPMYSIVSAATGRRARSPTVSRPQGVPSGPALLGSGWDRYWSRTSRYDWTRTLSRRLLNSCENFVLAPAYFDTWTPRKKDVVREYFVRTILQEDLTYEDPDLFLF